MGPQNREGAGARLGTIPVREGTSRDTTEYHRHPPNHCNEGAAHQPLPKHARQQPTRSRNATGSATNQLGRWQGVLGACEGVSAAKLGPAPLPARTRPQQPLRGRGRSGGMEGIALIGAQNITISGARGGAVPVQKGPFRDTTEYHRQLPSPCRPHRPREPGALWARERAPVAHGSAAKIRRGGVGVLWAGPAGRGAPGRCVLLSTM
jgi:hypothetical protein